MFLGIDIGTSGVKAVVLDEHGALAGQGSAPLTVSRPQPLWSEQNPDDWWQATSAAVMAIAPALRRAVRAVGLAGQMHGATLLGADDQMLRPAILWNDGRSFAECAELEASEPGSREITGNLAMPGFTAPKLLWVKHHEPVIFAQVHKVLLPKDYVRLCMTGEFASDLSDSAGTLWLDVAARDWSDAMLAAGSLVRKQMPKLFEGSEITGKLRSEVASLWGMEQVPVVAGGGDNAAGAAGVGVVADGQALLSLGTSGGDFRGNRGLPAQSRRRGACLLPLPARPVAPDGGAFIRRFLLRLGGAADRCERPRRSLHPGRSVRRGRRAGTVSALSLGRAHAA